MAVFSHANRTSSKTSISATPRTRWGRPKRPLRAPTRAEQISTIFSTADYRGSHMPIDTEIHWEWRNPLNLLPLLLLLFLSVALVAMVWP